MESFQYNPYQRLAYLILLEIAPKIMNNHLQIGERISIAVTWYKYLYYHGSAPEDVPTDWRKWGEKELEKIHDALVRYAIQKIFTQEKTSGQTAEKHGTVEEILELP